MVHWQIKLIDWRYGDSKWHGTPYRELSRIPGAWVDKTRPYIYGSLEEARRVASSFSDKMKSAYQIKIIKITLKQTKAR